MSGAVCTMCKGELWLCEDHPREPWPHCASAGMPCVCNPAAIMPGEFKAVAQPETLPGHDRPAALRRVLWHRLIR